METRLKCPLQDRTEPCPVIVGQAQINAQQVQVQEVCQACGNGCGYTLGEPPLPEPSPAGDE